MHVVHRAYARFYFYSFLICAAPEMGHKISEHFVEFCFLGLCLFVGSFFLLRSLLFAVVVVVSILKCGSKRDTEI